LGRKVSSGSWFEKKEGDSEKNPSAGLRVDILRRMSNAEVMEGLLDTGKV